MTDTPAEREPPSAEALGFEATSDVATDLATEICAQPVVKSLALTVGALCQFHGFLQERLDAYAAQARAAAIEEAATSVERFADNHTAYVPLGKTIKGDIGELTAWCKAAVRCAAQDVRSLVPPTGDK